MSKQAGGLTVGIIGGGSVAETAHLPGYTSHPAVEQTFLAEPLADRRKELVAEFNLARGYTDGRTLLARENVDVLSICTPPDTHTEFFAQVDGAVRAIYCEKPVAPSLREADRMAEITAEHEILTQVGYIYPYVENVKKALRLIKGNLLGKIQKVDTFQIRGPPESSWYYDPEKSGGGVIVDLLPHLLDFYFRLFDSSPEVKSVVCRHIDTDSVEDYAEITFRFGKTEVETTVMWTQPPSTRGIPKHMYKNIFVGRDGWIEFDFESIIGNIHGNSFEFRHGKPPKVNLYSLYRYWGQSADNFHTERIQDFVDHVCSNEQTIAPISRGIKIRKIIDEIYEMGER